MATGCRVHPQVASFVAPMAHASFIVTPNSLGPFAKHAHLSPLPHVRLRARAFSHRPSARRARATVPTAAATAAATPSSSGAAARPRPVDYATLAHCVAAISALAVPARVEAVQQPSATRLVLGVRTLDASYRIVLSFSQTHGRLVLVPPAARGESRPARAAAQQQRYSLAATARALLASASALVAVRIAAPFDRVVALDFAPAPSEPPTIHIFLELLGNGRSNLVLTDATLAIKACGKQVAQRSANRALQTGLTYTPPPPPRGMHPTDPTLSATLLRLSAENAGQEKAMMPAGTSLAKALVRTVAGVSPAVAQWICARSNLDPDRPLRDFAISIDESWATVLVAALGEWYEGHALPERVACRRSKLDDFPAGGADINGQNIAYELEFLPSSSETDFSSVRERLLSSGILLENYYGDHENNQIVDARAGKFAKVLERRIAKSRSRADVFSRKVDECDSINHLRRDAEVLLSFAHTWSRGDKRVRGEWIGPVGGSNVPCDTVQVVEVQLPDDCDVTPIDYGQQLYKKADKLARARVIAQSRLDEAMLEVEWLEGMAVSLDMARSIDDIAELETEISIESAESMTGSRFASNRGKTGSSVGQKGKVKSKTNGRRLSKSSVAKRSDGTSSSPSKLLSGVLVFKRGALEVLVGRNARGNETVTFDIAKKGDAWMHAAGTAGAHVIVRQRDGSILAIDAEKETIEFAADLAAYFSKSSQAANVPVSVLRAADIRRAPGSPRRLGSVILSKAAQTVNAKPLRVQKEALAALSRER